MKFIDFYKKKSFYCDSGSAYEHALNTFNERISELMQENYKLKKELIEINNKNRALEIYSNKEKLNALIDEQIRCLVKLKIK